MAPPDVEAVVRLWQGEMPREWTCCDESAAQMRGIARAFLRAVGAETVARMLADWALKRAGIFDGMLRAAAEGFATVTHAEVFTAAVVTLPTDQLRAFLPLCRDPGVAPWSRPFPEEPRQALAAKLRAHPDPAVQAWTAEVPLPGETAQPTVTTVKPIGRARLLRAIEGCRDGELNEVVGIRYMQAPVIGLCYALRRRRRPPIPCVPVVLALLHAPDPWEEIDELFSCWCPPRREFLAQVEDALEAVASKYRELNYYGCAWRHRVEADCFRWGKCVESSGLPLATHLERARAGHSPVLRRLVWQAAEQLMRRWRTGDHEKFVRQCHPELAETLVRALPTELVEEAAGLLALMASDRTARTMVDRFQREAELSLPRLSAETQEKLYDWLRLRVAAPRRAAALAQASAPIHYDSVAPDLRLLVEQCLSTDESVARPAAGQLARKGGTGEGLLAGMILASDIPPHVAALTETIQGWNPHGNAYRQVRDRVCSGGMHPLPGGLAAQALIAKGDKAVFPALCGYLAMEDSPYWFTAEHWKALQASGLDYLAVERGLALSAQPAAYLPAVLGIMQRRPGKAEREDVAAMRGFLEAGTERGVDLRYRVAQWLVQIDPEPAVPALLAGLAGGARVVFHGNMHRLPVEALRAMVHSVLASESAREETLLRSLLHSLKGPVPGVLKELYLETSVQETRDLIKTQLGDTFLAVAPARLAETFAWGVRTARRLTGHTFRIHILDDGNLGYTRLDRHHIWVCPLPLLRGERNGEAVLRGLILHELGHHLFHAGTENQKVWDEAAAKNVRAILNLVADEHLERNLRSSDAGYGDDLKSLAAYAFLRNSESLDTDELLRLLGDQVAPVLTQVRLRPARETPRVLIEAGSLLRFLEKRGDSFARFMRGLRTGLGDRHGDAKVARALALFQGKFRKQRMPELLKTAQQLREIFWGATAGTADLALALGPVAAWKSDGNGEVRRLTGGLTDEELQRAIEQANREHAARSKNPADRAFLPEMNRSAETDFDKIETVERLAADPSGFASVAKERRAESRQLRSFFAELGRRNAVVGPRGRGRRIMASQLGRLVLRRDPRVLAAVNRVPATDLFLGVVIDCSGSMQVDDHIALARRFGVLVASATRGDANIDARFWGFTSERIFDCGTADDCAVTRLEAHGGNNDAAALWHAARAAERSRRKSKLLVMISDGLPTECSVGALRRLVSDLQRRRFCCAQVTVYPLEEICFPHYIEITEADFAAATRNFGRVIARLVRHALSP